MDGLAEASLSSTWKRVPRDAHLGVIRVRCPGKTTRRGFLHPGRCLR